MCTIVIPEGATKEVRLVLPEMPEGEVRIPGWVVDLESFHCWTDSEEFPERGRISYIAGEVWVDMSDEQLFTHNQVKTEFASVLYPLVRTGRLGRYFVDGVRLSNVKADVSNQADGTFVAAKSLRSGRVRLVEGAEAGYVRLEGSADMALEVLSDSSVRKDTVLLRETYWRAGITEYWLVDVRGDEVRFDILRHTSKGYVPARKRDRWMKSKVFGKEFRLVRHEGPDGYPAFTLEVR